MENVAVDEAVEAFLASAAELADCVRRGVGSPGSGVSGSGGSDPLREQADACLDGLGVSARVGAMVAGLTVRLVSGFADKSEAMAAPATSPGQHTAQEMGVVSEVACALTVSERSASALLAQSRELSTTLPLTLAALHSGNISWQHARVMVDETASLDPAGAAALEAHFLDPDAPHPARWCPAGDMVPSRFRHKARTWRERHHPVSIEVRHAKSFLDRRLEYAPDRDGMAWLSANLPADQAAGIWNGVTATARALQGPTEDRTLTQLRADVAAKLLLSAGFTTSNPTAGSTDAVAGTGSAGDGVAGRVPATDGIDDAVTGLLPAPDGVNAGRVPSPAAQVLVTVPVFALMGLTDEPADLDGYGPIPASMARKLVADGASSFRRVLIDPRDGAPLETGRASYRIPASMRQWLRMRDGKCSFPGCNNQSLDNEADHILAWADGGTTGISNLGSLCRKHHRLKHSTAWRPNEATKDEPPGWTSPTGRHYKSEHQDWETPQWPPHILDQLSRRERGPVVPEHIQSEYLLPADPPAEVAVPEDVLPGQPPPEELLPEEPLPEWVRLPWPIGEQHSSR
ncbi:HNH endonuclease signature motif containing protein [Arthrobacter sp. S39]|uniref:HNH endonuclease signature motif containing protein n=1 Tax=Arthrobacter sp. S39 TaxID=2509720 RepID=UPI001037165E|nr:HNH endonuclease signature motif containing protein [Arthrobacter sp. S39]TAP43672.1 HNH endonuclease [Arthrobacter sp. S39]